MPFLSGCQYWGLNHQSSQGFRQVWILLLPSLSLVHYYLQIPLKWATVAFCLGWMQEYCMLCFVFNVLLPLQPFLSTYVTEGGVSPHVLAHSPEVDNWCLFLDPRLVIGAGCSVVCVLSSIFEQALSTQASGMRLAQGFYSLLPVEANVPYISEWFGAGVSTPPLVIKGL